MKPTKVISSASEIKGRQKVHDPKVAERFKQFRIQYIGKTHKEAGEALGVAASKISYIENCQETPNYKIIDKMVNKYHLNVEWLSKGKGGPVDKEPSRSNNATTLISINAEIITLNRHIQMLEANESHFLKVIENYERRLDGMDERLKKLENR